MFHPLPNHPINQSQLDSISSLLPLPPPPLLPPHALPKFFNRPKRSRLVRHNMHDDLARIQHDPPVGLFDPARLLGRFRSSAGVLRRRGGQTRYERRTGRGGKGVLRGGRGEVEGRFGELGKGEYNILRQGIIIQNKNVTIRREEKRFRGKGGGGKETYKGSYTFYRSS